MLEDIKVAVSGRRTRNPITNGYYEILKKTKAKNENTNNNPQS